MTWLYWLTGAAIVLLVAAPFINAAIDTHDRRVEHRIERESQQRTADLRRYYERVRLRSDLLDSERQLRALGLDAAADKFRARADALPADIKADLDRLKADLERPA